jgi:hypothetical protein
VDVLFGPVVLLGAVCFLAVTFVLGAVCFLAAAFLLGAALLLGAVFLLPVALVPAAVCLAAWGRLLLVGSFALSTFML